MPTQYATVYVDERYSPILDPNLYPDSALVPGVTYNDVYQGDAAAGLVKIYRQSNDGAAPVGQPANDFENETITNELIDLRLNNSYRKSKKIYQVQANAVSYALADQTLSNAVEDVRQGWQSGGLACLVNGGTASADTDSLTTDNIKQKIIATRADLRKKFANPDVVLATVDTYSLMLEVAGKDYTPVTNESMVRTGRVGVWLGMTWIEANALDGDAAQFYNFEGNLTTVDLSLVDFVMYDHRAFHVVKNLNVMRVIDSEHFSGSLAQVEINVGYRVSNAARVAVKSHAAGEAPDETP